MDALAQTPRPRRVIVGVSGASGAALGLECLRCLRAADVQMKEQRRLVLMVRETPLSAVHVDNMARLARVPGVMLMPPLLTFYNGPQTVEDMVHHVACKALGALGVEVDGFRRWNG